MPLNQAQGFTLPEVLLAMAIGSVVMLAAASGYPPIYLQGQRLGQRVWLEQALHQAANRLEKDLRRAGFCAGEQCGTQAILLGAAPGEAAGSCVQAAYDLNRNGRWERSGPEAEIFGYRLSAGALETRRGEGCHGAGWERLLDPAEVTVTQFQLARQGEFYRLTLAAQGARTPAVHRQIERLMQGRAR